MFYELWDTRTANLVGAFGTEEEALQIVRLALADFGRDFVSSWALGVEDGDGEEKIVARGPALTDLALARLPA